MRFLSTTLALFLMASGVAFANPSDTICKVEDGTDTIIDIAIDGTSGSFEGLNAFKSSAPEKQISFPTTQVKNFWIDAYSLKIRGYNPATQKEDLLIEYDRKLDTGRITLSMPGYKPINNQLISCTFD